MRYEQGGAEALRPKRGGRKSMRTQTLRRRLYKLFDAGSTVTGAYEATGKRVSRTLVGRMRKEWAAERDSKIASTPSRSAQHADATLREPMPEQMALIAEVTANDVQQQSAVDTRDEATAMVAPSGTVDSAQAADDALPRLAAEEQDATTEAQDATAPAVANAMADAASESTLVTAHADDESATAADSAPDPQDIGRLNDPEPTERSDTTIETALDVCRKEMPLQEALERGSDHVQHAGAWIMLGMLNLLGVYRRAEQHRPRNVGRVALRVALDAVAIALVIGQYCVEGVRRLATPSAPTLLRSKGAPSASWTRRVLGKFADAAAVLFHLGTTVDLIQDAGRGEQRRAIFYADNHLRPYTGKHTIRKGWRMQDKCVRPGVSDYYIHDEDGRPLMRVDVPSHGSLVQKLLPIGRFLQRSVGDEAKVLLVFDRAGAFAENMASLRDEGFEFITYERAPYQVLAASEFDQKMEVGDAGDRITIAFTEQRKNLRFGRGRVRRIAMRMPDGEQVNIVGYSKASPQQLIVAMLARWARQENQFKHEVERWGINQIDSYKVQPCSPDDIIPNPARRRLDRALRVAKAAEGEALRRLAHLPTDDRRRDALEQEVRRLAAMQAALETQRPNVPKRAPLRDTELNGKLVEHRGKYKTVIDTLRIVLANAESELAAMLGPLLPKEDEAKKTLNNLLVAPGQVQLTKRCIRVVLAPAATRAELGAFQALLKRVNGLGLTLPGDPAERRLHFEVHI
jgi:hypothetical protein